MRIRRSNFLFFYHSDQNLADLRFRSSSIRLKPGQIFAFPILYGTYVTLWQEEMQLLMEIPTNQWVSTSTSKLELSMIMEMVGKGIILTDSPHDPKAILFKWREEILEKEGWNLFSALQFFMGRWKGVDAKVPLSLWMHSELIEDSLPNLNGLSEPNKELPSEYSPPRRFEERNVLPQVNRDGLLDQLFQTRRTCRNFDVHKKMDIKNFSTLIHYVFGVHGTYDIPGKYRVLKKNNPSGGAMHSINVYILVLRVEGISPGLYEYEAGTHSLNCIKSYDLEEAKNKSLLFACKQGYAADASALFVLSSRFYRSFWKYRQHPKMLSYHYQEAGHISQNFYLVAGKLGLGAVTTSMNDWDIDEEIGLNSFQEGSIMLLGCGIPLKGPELQKYEEMKFTDKDHL